MCRIIVILALLSLSAAALAIDSAVAIPPSARRRPHKLEWHDETRIDEFLWMKDGTDKEVLKYLEAENAYAAAVLKPTYEIQGKLYKEFLSRIKQTDQDVPVLDRGYWYYSRTLEGNQYPIHCRKQGSLDAVEEMLLDGNRLSRGEKFFSFGERRVSADGKLLAYSTDTTGCRDFKLSVKDISTDRLLDSEFAVAPMFEWAEDNKTLFYVTEDAAKRAHKVWRHFLGDPREKDELVYEEKDDLFWLELGKSRDGKYLFHSSVSYGSTEQRFLPSDLSSNIWKIILKRETGHEYAADHRGGQFYIRTNNDAKNFKVVTCPVEDTSLAKWTSFVAYDSEIYIEDTSLFKDHLVLSVRMGGAPRLIVRELESCKFHAVPCGGNVFDVHILSNPEFVTTAFRFTYTSLAEPEIVFEYDMNSRERHPLKVTEVPGGYNPDDYVMEKLIAIAPDGVGVPISLIYRKGTQNDGTAPCVLHAYGAYGLNIPLKFDPIRVSLLDRGAVIAIAHVRGGSDLGRTWYDDGKMLKKMNTFYDFIACAEHLISRKYCDKNRLVIEGASAGGLLVAAVLNLRPDLCRAAVLEVPFVDAITTLLDETIPSTVPEFQQWGNPKVKAEYDYIKRYCPYSNLKKVNYPAMLVMTSLHDSQVLFHEPTKYVAKLRALKTDKNPLLLRCNLNAGHGGASGRYDHFKEQAEKLAFILDQMDLIQ